MANGILIAWHNLPDPRVRTGDVMSTDPVKIEVPSEIWRKIRDDHIGCGRQGRPEERSDQPWGDWLIPPDVFNGVWHRMMPWIRQALGIIRSDVQKSLERPRFLRAQALTARGELRKPWPEWLLVLPCGALVVILLRDGKSGVLESCYFIQDSCQEADRQLRWRALLRYLVINHTREDITRKLPDPHDWIRGEKTGLNTGIRFVIPKNWGFDGDGPGARWSFPFEDWDGNPEPEQKLRLGPWKV